MRVDINFLPSYLRNWRLRYFTAACCAGVLIGVIGFCCLSWTLLEDELALARDELDTVWQMKQDLAPELRYREVLMRELVFLSAKTELLSLRDQVSWADVLDTVQSSVPPGVIIEEIAIDHMATVTIGGRTESMFGLALMMAELDNQDMSISDMKLDRQFIRENGESTLGFRLQMEWEGGAP